MFIYHCPFCSSALIKTDSLFCNSCQVYFPVVNGFIFFNEPQVNFSHQTENAFNYEFDRFQYADFLIQKAGKTAPDLYAAFQPFNESSRAFEPFIPFLKQNLKPGDVILDLWCRTGWSALYLSGLFPDQKIISVWEGNKGVLGYQGFSFWFDELTKPSNLVIIFSDINKNFPLPDQSVKLVYGLDTLHRYSKPNIINETLRVTSNDGFLIFPHVHLSNNQPDPFFERGGDILHGEQWDFYLTHKLKNSGRKHFIFSEPELFENPETIPLQSNPNTPDYNGLIAVFPEHNLPVKLEKWNYEPNHFEDQFIYINPLLEFQYSHSRVKLNLTKWDSGVEYILKRHPVYHKKLNEVDSVTLDSLALKICFLSHHRYSVSDIAKKLNCSLQDLKQKIEDGIAMELFRLYPLKNHNNYLQFFHTDQLLRPSPKLCTFTDLWKSSINKYSDRILIHSIKDESEFSYADTDRIVRKIIYGLHESGVKKGDSVLIFSNITEEFILCAWAVWLSGAILIPVNPELSDAEKLDIIEVINPNFVFFDPNSVNPTFLSEVKIPIVSFSSEQNVSFDFPSLTDWLPSEDPDEWLGFAQVSHSDTACMLFTSGTTSKSKIVSLSHEALFNSSAELTNLFQWRSDDIILNLGDSFTMSGLRNPSWSAIHSGASILVIPSEDKKHPLKIADHIFRHHVTVLGCVPEMVRLLLASSEHISPKLLKPLKQIICTAAYLSESVRIKFEEYFLKPILNYYGLTETCGLCAGHQFSDHLDTNDSIGKPVDAILQIVDETGNALEPNKIGRLRVFSTNLMKEYYNNSEATHAILMDGWLYTGDLALIDENGFVYLKGRDRDIIKLKDGNLIYPDSIENILLQHSTVSEAAVTSVSQIGDRESIIAFVKLKSGNLTPDLTFELKNIINSNLGRHFVPEIFVQSEELPKGVNGKILKSILQSQYESKPNHSF